VERAGGHLGVPPVAMTAKKAAPAARFGIRRAKPIKDGGIDVPTVMGLANSTNFQPTAGRAMQRSPAISY